MRTRKSFDVLEPKYPPFLLIILHKEPSIYAFPPLSGTHCLFVNAAKDA